MSARWCAAGLLAAGCYAPTDFDLRLEALLHPGAQSVVLAVPAGAAAEDAAFLAYSAQRGGPAQGLTLEEGTQLAAVVLDQSLEELELSAGLVSHAAGAQRPLPAGRYFRTLSDGTGGEWSPTDSAGAALEGLRLPAVDCSSGCFVHGPGSNLAADQCVRPCPIEQAAAPELRPFTVAPPQPPRPVPCPEGWSAVPLSCGGSCRPPAPAPLLDCPPGQYQPYPRPDCVAVGSPCDRRFPAVDPLGTLYVDVAAPPPGLGTESEPLASLADALARAPARIALARGVYLGPFTAAGPLEVVGACAAETVLASDKAPAVLSADSDLRLRDLSVRGGIKGVDFDGSTSGGRLEMSDCILEGSQRVGVHARGSAALRRSALRGQSVAGVVLESATSTVEDVVIDGVGGVAGTDGSAMKVERSRVELRRTALRRTHAYVSLMLLESAATIDALEIRDSTGVGVLASGGASPARLDARALFIRGMRNDPLLGAAGVGLQLQAATASVSESALEDCDLHLVSTATAGALALHRSALRNTGAEGRGLQARSGRLELGSVWAEQGGGLWLKALHSTVGVSDATLWSDGGSDGERVEIAATGSTVTLDRTCLVGQRALASAVGGGRLALTDVDAPGPGVPSAREPAVALLDRASATLERVHVGRMAGLASLDDASFSASDVLFDPHLEPGLEAVALHVARSSLRLSRVRMRGLPTRGVETTGDGRTPCQVMIDDLELSELSPPLEPGGEIRAALSLTFARFEVRRVRIAGAGQTGLRLDKEAMGTLSDLEVVGASGLGLDLESAVEVALERVRVTGARTGLLLNGLAPTFDEPRYQLSDLSISGGEVGVVARFTNAATFSRFAVAGTRACGIELDPGLGLVLESGTIQSLGPGVCFNAGANLEAIQPGVGYGGTPPLGVPGSAGR